ncbi:hypothetical protein MMC22_001676 [Lobaria immixta]|nr:hypothetical protein [Lobaria immixta]
MEKSSPDRHTDGPDPNGLLPLTKSETSSIASIKQSSHVNQQEEPESQDELESEDDVGWSRLIVVVIALILSIFMVALDMTIVATAVPKITDQFHGLDLVGWYGSAFFLTLASFQSTWGKAYKYFPLKRSFLISMAVAGAGGAGIASGAYTIIAFAAKPSQRPAFTGIIGAAYGVASVIGPLLGGVFTDKLSWRWCFYINLPLGGVSVAILVLFFKTPKRAVTVEATWKERFLQIDLMGSFVIMAAAVCYLLAMQWGGISKKWSSGGAIGILVGFGILVILFVFVEWMQGERAVIVGRLLRQRTISVGLAFAFFLGGSFFTLLYYIPVYFQVIDDVSAAQSGIRNLALIIAVSISTIFSGSFIGNFGHFVPFLIVGGSLATIGSGLIFTLGLNSPSSMWIGYQVLAGIGIGLCIQVPIIAAQAVVEPGDISSVTAMTLFFQTIGGAFFVSASQSVFINYVINTLPKNAPSVDAAKVVATGVTELRSVFPADVIPGLLRSYLSGIHAAFAVALVSAGIATIVSFSSKWRTIKVVE